MNSFRLFPALLLSAALTALFAFAARAEEIKSTVAFSQPDQPGTVRIQVARGAVEIKGTDAAEVVVLSESAPVRSTPRPDGLRVISSASSFTLTEKNNVITLDAMSEFTSGRPGQFKVLVPRSASVVVQNSWGGEIRCTGVAGSLEITGLNGPIFLEDIANGAVVSTMNGEITASIRELQEGKPLSFQSMNGQVALRLPASAKASLRVRTQNGSVLTDFDEAVLQTKTETAATAPLASRHVSISTGQSVLTPEAKDAIREAARVGAEAIREAAHAMKEAAEAAREGAQASRSAGVTASAPAAARAPRPPKPSVIPTITGGKVVTGTLNGGGTEINIATMNGDVTLRRTAN
jgi:hypothetical protein